MDLSTKLVKDFAKMVNESSSEEKPITQLYGTVRVVNEAKYVQLDGSDNMTPIAEVVDAQDKDRVLVSIENHKATIVGNFTYPPSARKTNEALTAASDALTKSEEAEDTAKDALDATKEYDEQISSANAAAQEAKTNASTAATLATEASNKANDVFALAEQAKSAASQAESKAASAMTNVGAANEALKTLRSEVTTVQGDISTIRSDVQSELETHTQTISATYAKKTDVTTLEGALRTEISQSAAGLRTTMSEQYVAKSDHVTIQANLQTQITANAEGISSSAKKITQLETDTSEAQKAIDAAQEDADAALAAAGEAQSKANAAQTTANEATAKANAADAALTQAKADLATAKANLAEVTGRVDATEDEIAAAQAEVTKAQTAVEKAQKDATAAQTAAGEAKTAANTAQSKANEAKAAADKAQEDANALKSRVTIAETKITQTADSIESIASRTEAVENKFGDYSTTAQMNSAINQKANAITSTVSATYATKDNVSAVANKADDAYELADLAGGYAYDAKSVANTAKSTAETAASDASTAKSTASTAAANASTALSTAEQTATKFSWIVKSGTSSSNFTLTDRMATLVADNINLTGKVTFSSFDTNTQNTINAAVKKADDAYFIADAAGQMSYIAKNALAAWCHETDTTFIDGSKIYTGSINADKLNVTSLDAICATIGGFTIGDASLIAEKNALASIKLNFAVNCADGRTRYGMAILGNYPYGDEVSGLYIEGYDSSSYIPYGVNIGSTDTGAISIRRTDTTTSSALIIDDESIYISDALATLKIYNQVQIDECVYIDYSAIYSDHSIGMQIGTSDYPTGDHYIYNNSGYNSQTMTGDTTNLIKMSGNDNILIGYYNNKYYNVYTYLGNNGKFTINHANLAGTDYAELLALYYSSEGYALKVPCVYSLTTSSGNAVYTTSNGLIRRYSSSSRRYKEAISEKLSDHLNPEMLYDLPVVEFVYKEGHLSKSDQRYGEKFIGFIAEDVADIYPIAANRDDDGSVENWNINLMVPAMLKLIQDQHKVDNTLNSQVETLKNQLDEAMIKIASLEKQIDILKTA